eukprot:scaffold859_cov59-Phaeocystis_antarctica.AAC.2
MPITEGLALPLHSASRYSGSAAARSPFVQHHAEVVDGAKRGRMPIAEDLAPPVHRASRSSGSAAARSPLALNSRPRLLMQASVF